jgi:hypothetical protein
MYTMIPVAAIPTTQAARITVFPHYQVAIVQQEGWLKDQTSRGCLLHHPTFPTTCWHLLYYFAARDDIRVS